MVSLITNFKKYIMKTSLIIVLFITSISVFAHGTGMVLEINQDGYQIDIDLDILEPRAGQAVRFDFDLLDIGEKGLKTDFNYIWVRIQKGQKVVFAGGIGKADFGPTGFTTVLPESGRYVISTRFQMDGEKLVEADTDFDVSEEKETGNSEPFFNLRFLIGAVAGLAVGILISPLLRRK